MLRALHTAATGMEAQQLKIDVTANNLSNVNTVGFKKSRGDFQELMYQTIRGPGVESSQGTTVPTGTQVGLGVRTVSTQKLHSQGPLKNTGNQLDVAIEGRGLFPVVRGNGDIAYTRSGDFKTDAEGRLVTSDGYALDPEIVIPPDATTVEFGEDGTVSVRQAGQAEATQIGQLQLAGFVNPSGLVSIGRNLYLPTNASGAAVHGTPGEEGLGSLTTGFLEQSNVSVVDEMIELIVGQRSYEMNSKVIQAADQMLRTAATLR